MKLKENFSEVGSELQWRLSATSEVFGADVGLLFARGAEQFVIDAEGVGGFVVEGGLEFVVAFLSGRLQLLPGGVGDGAFSLKSVDVLADEFRTAVVVGCAKDGADGGTPKAGIVQKGATGGEEKQEGEKDAFHGVSFYWGWAARQ